MAKGKGEQSAYGAAMLQLLETSPAMVLSLMERKAVLASKDRHVVVAYALAVSRTPAIAGTALEVWQHLLSLSPNDVEVACACADAAIEAGATATAVQMLELCFGLDVEAKTPAGRRARVLAVRLDKQLALRR